MTRPLGTRVLTAALLAVLAIPATAAEVTRLDIVDARKADSQPKVCCLSGADTSPSGALLIVSDKSTLFNAQLDASAGTLTLTISTPLTLSNGAPVPGGRADAEGVAIGFGGATHISFEGRHRVALYDEARGVSSAPAPSKLNLPENGGLEALAVDAAGALWAIPETATGAGFPLLRYAADQWETVDMLPASGGYLPVGADFDASGALYVLERRFSFFKFRSRVRRLTLGTDGIAATGTVWESETGAFDNLEALVVVEGAGQPKALLMISDDNAMPFQETQALLLELSE